MFQSEKFITSCITSILRQTFKNFELIIVNDGSTDDSERLAKNVLVNANISWKIINQENQGQAAARNRGLHEASGQYIIFIDSDDTVDDTFVEQLYLAIKNNDVDFAFCNYAFVKKSNFEKKGLGNLILLSRDEIIHDFLYRKKQIIITGLILKKDYIIDNHLCFDNDSRFSEDLIFLWKLIYSCNRCMWVDKQLYYYFIHPNSIMTSSKYINILNGYQQFCFLTDELELRYPLLVETKLILPRWKLGCLYSAAHILTYTEFKSLCFKLNYKNLFTELYTFKDAKVFLSALILKLNVAFFYKLARIL